MKKENHSIAVSFGRRRFLQGLGGFAAAVAMPSFGVVGANERVRIGIIGCGGRGRSLGKVFSFPGVELVAVSDVDTTMMDKMLGKDTQVARYQDYRKLLDRDDIDAVVIATPNHWHALQMIHACAAGKDVYVEKPVTFHTAEGKAMLAAQEKYGRIVQAGTQNRSDTGLISAFDYIHSGEIGKITKVHGLCSKQRKAIGKLDQPLQIPETVDWDLWLGGCADLPIMRPQLHYDWHWDFNTGNGDIGNQGPHELDLISWVLGDPAIDVGVRAFGNRFAWDDAGNTPNLMAMWTELAGVPVLFEVNNLWVTPSQNEAAALRGVKIGVIVSCEGGEFRGGRGGGYVVGEDGKTKIKEFPGDSGATHAQNFIDAVKSRDGSKLRGKLEHAVSSVELAHLANVSVRVGEAAKLGELREVLGEHQNEILDRQVEQLGVWSVDLDKTPYLLGPEVTVNKNGEVQGPDAVAKYAKPVYRTGYEVPGA